LRPMTLVAPSRSSERTCMKSFGFQTDLRAATGGTAFPQMAFDHWEMVQSDCYEDGSKAAEEFIIPARKRKGCKDLDTIIPPSSDYTDKL
jgi:elongation factor 2